MKTLSSSVVAALDPSVTSSAVPASPEPRREPFFRVLVAYIPLLARLTKVEGLVLLALIGLCQRFRTQLLSAGTISRVFGGLLDGAHGRRAVRRLVALGLVARTPHGTPTDPTGARVSLVADLGPARARLGLSATTNVATLPGPYVAVDWRFLREVLPRLTKRQLVTYQNLNAGV